MLREAFDRLGAGAEGEGEPALEQVELQRRGFRRWGIWGDWDQPYLTLRPHYEAAQIAVFGAMVLAGRIYRGLKPVHWSPSSRTALAEAESDAEVKRLLTALAQSTQILGQDNVRAAGYLIPEAARLQTLLDAGTLADPELSAQVALIRRLVDEQLPAGRHEAVWQGRDDSGRSVASGVSARKGTCPVSIS